MEIPFLDLRTQYLELKEEIDYAVAKVLNSGWYILGKECNEFESEFKKYLVDDNEGYVIGVNSGTDALKLSLLAAGVGHGDEVITVANTAIPTATAICSIGAIPVFCDVDPKTWLINPDLIEASITRKTKCIIPVHLYGAACNLEPLLNVAQRYGLSVIEDVAQATGADYLGRKCGTIGDFGAFSFYPSKNLGANGDGGAVFVRKSAQRDLLRMLRNYGQSSRYSADIQGGENSRLDEIQAAILRIKLRHLNRWNKKRFELSRYYREGFKVSGLDLSLQEEYKGTSSANHLFVVKSNRDIRDRLIHKMSERGIQTLIHYPYPLYLQPAFKRYIRIKNESSEELCASILSLPFHQYLRLDEIDYVIKTMRECINEI